MLTAEDATVDTLIPRLQAAGANLALVQELNAIKRNNREEAFLLSEDIEALEMMIRDFGDVGLVTVDPITAYMGGGKHFDSHRATDVRSQLSPLKKLAELTRIAFSAVTHPPKNASARALDHFIGSQAFIAAARIGHLCVAEMEETEEGRGPTGRRFFTNPKINIGPRQATLAYRIGVVDVGFDEEANTVISAPVIQWEGPVDVTADEALAASKPAKKNGSWRENSYSTSWPVDRCCSGRSPNAERNAGLAMINSGGPKRRLRLSHSRNVVERSTARGCGHCHSMFHQKRKRRRNSPRRVRRSRYEGREGRNFLPTATFAKKASCATFRSKAISICY